MRISGSDRATPGLNLIGSMSKISDRKSNLIFVYPLLFDKSLIKRWEIILRDFLTAQFISQIKISNVLNITQAAIQGYGQTSDIPYLNPAEILNNALNNHDANYQTALQTKLTDNQSKQFDTINKHSISSTEYAYKLNEFREFIKQQILSDPVYDNLRPAFSIITMENNLIDIPLIIGTKSYKIDSSALYWILFVSLMGNNLNINNFSKIQEILNSLPIHDFIKLIPNTINPIDINATDAIYNKLRQETNVSIKRSLDTFKTVTSSLTQFEQDIGFSISISSDDVLYKTTIEQSGTEKNEMKSKIATLVNQTIVSTVFPMLQTINNLIVNPALETNYIDRYKLLLGDISNKLFPLTDAFINIYSGRLSNNETSEDFIKSLQSDCIAIQNIKSYDLLTKINTVRLKFTDIRNDVAIGRGTNSRIINFAEELNIIASSLATQSQTLVTMVKTFTGDNNIDTIYKNLVQSVYDDFVNYFSRPNDTPDPNIKLGNPIFDLNANNPPLSQFFQSIFAGATSLDLKRFLQNSIKALSEVTAFIFLYSNFSYFCEFINIIKSKIEIKSKDIIEFPNYTIIIPIEYVTTLYYALAAKNTSDLLKSINRTDPNNPTDMVKFNLSENNIFRIIQAITERLNVKNIIIIDSNKKEIYYKWCYLKRAIKLNESTLSNYIRSQTNITSAF